MPLRSSLKLHCMDHSYKQVRNMGNLFVHPKAKSGYLDLIQLDSIGQPHLNLFIQIVFCSQRVPIWIHKEIDNNLFNGSKQFIKYILTL